MVASSFSIIPADLRVPVLAVEVDASAAFQPSGQRRALIIAQRTSAGAVAEGVPTQLPSEAAAITAFGVGSIMHLTAKAFRANNSITELVGIGVDDVGVAYAEGTITFGGTATAAGTVYLYIAGQRVLVDVPNGTAFGAVATAATAAINLVVNLPVTAAAPVGGAIVLAAKNAGTLGNSIDVRVNYLGPDGGEELPAGITFALTAAMGVTTPGAADPVLTTTIAAMGEDPYHWIVLAQNDTTGLAAMRAELNDSSTGRWGPMRGLYGHMFYGYSAASASALGTYGNTLDTTGSQHFTMVGATSSPTPPWEWAGEWGGVASLSLNANPARPLQTLALATVKAPASASRYTLTERNTLLFDGAATWTVDAGGTVHIERSITTYQSNAAGSADAAYLDVQTLATLQLMLEEMSATILATYPRHVLVDNDTRVGAGTPIVTPSAIEGLIVALYREWMFRGLAENIDAFKAALIVERNATDPNRVDVLFPPDLANQLRVIGLLAQFRLQFSEA
jgi:phage tail sheath gpL-like